KGDRQQHWQSPHAIDRQIQQLAGGWIDPVGVLKNHQHGSPSCLGFELAEKSVEQLLSLALRAEIEINGRTWQRQQLAQEREILVPRARHKQRAELAELGFDGVVAGEARGAFELDHEWVKRTVLVMRRAEMAQAHMGLGFDLLGKR